MKARWTDRRCVLCALEGPLTEEHVIPQAIGGSLTCDFLCKPCNDRLGQTEAHLKSDPAVRLAIENLKGQVPLDLYRTVSEAQSFIMKSRGGQVKATFKRGTMRVNPSRQSDGSLVQPTENAPKAIRTMMERRGLGEAEIQEAMKRFEEGPEDSRVTLANGIDIVKWTVTEIHPALDSPRLDPVVPLKIAYEYLALHYGTSIFHPSLGPVREALGQDGPVPDVCRVERLRARRYRPFHGLVVEKNSPYPVVQIRLFGYLVYRVHFLNIRIAAGPHLAYTLHLDTGEEELRET